MTEVYFFGRESILPNFFVEKFEENVSLKQIIFGPLKEKISKESEVLIKLNKKLAKKDSPEIKPHIKYIDCGSSFVYLIDDTNDLWFFGEGNFHNLGDKKITSSNKIPVNISKIYNKKFEKVACGERFVLATEMSTQKLFLWGEFCKTMHKKPREINLEETDISKGSQHQQHLKNPEKKQKETILPLLSEPNHRVTDIFAKNEHAFFLVNKRSYVFGIDYKCVFGLGAHKELLSSPTFIPNMKIEGICSSESHSLAWDCDGHIYSWGDSSNGKLGHPLNPKNFNMKSIEPYPKKINFFIDKAVIMAACTKNSSCALTNQGIIYKWGKGDYSKQCDPNIIPDLMEALQPSILNVFGNTKPIKFIKVCGGLTHYAAMDSSGKLYTWGDCTDYCLGTPELLDRVEACSVKILNHKKVLDIGCGDRFTVVIATDLQNKLPSLAVQSFNQKNFAQIKNQVKVLKEFAKKKEEINNRPEIPYAKTNPIDFQPKVMKKQLDYTSDSIPKSNSFLRLPSKTNININRKKSEEFLELSQRLLTEINTVKKDEIISSKHLKNLSNKNINTEGSDPINPKYFSNFEISDERNEILELIQKLNKTVQFQEITTEEGNKTIVAQHIYDNVADEMVYKQENDANFIPLDGLIGSRVQTEENTKFDEELVGNLAFAEDITNDSLSHIRSKMLVNQLNSILKSKNDLLKYEYIEMVRKGDEEELMKYLLNDPKDDKNNEFNNELERVLRRKLAISNFSKKSKKIQTFTEESALIEQIDEIKQKLTSNLPRNLLEKIEMSIRKTDKLLGSSIEYYEQCKRKDKEDEASIYEDSDIYKARKYHKIVEQASKRDQRINVAKMVRENLKKEKEDNILQTIHKKSIDYKKKLAKIRIENDVFNEKIKKIFTCFNVNLLLNFIHSLAQEGVEFKRKMFQYNMKARILQNYFKKILIKKKILSLDVKQVKALRIFVWNFRFQQMLKKKRSCASKIHLNLIILCLKRRIKTKMVIFRNNVINLQRFFLWSYKLYVWQIAHLSQIFDNHLLHNWKSDNPKPIPTSIEQLSDKKEIIPNSPNRRLSTTTIVTKEKNINQLENDNFLSYKEYSNIIKDINNKRFAKLNNKARRTNIYKLLIPSIMPHTLDIKSDYKVRTELDEHVKYVEEEEDIFKQNKEMLDTLLPYTIHRDYINLPMNIKVKVDVNPTHFENIYGKLISAEITIKYEIIKKHLRELVKKFLKSIKSYKLALSDFVNNNQHQIDLERARLMLRTTVKDLKDFHRKEEFELKFNITLDKMHMNTIQNTKRDHLPFSNLIHKIASTLPNSPPKPVFKLKLEKDAFKALFQTYFANFKKVHHTLSVEMRMMGGTMKITENPKKSKSEENQNVTQPKSPKSSFSKKKQLTEEIAEVEIDDEETMS